MCRLHGGGPRKLASTSQINPGKQRVLIKAGAPVPSARARRLLPAEQSAGREDKLQTCMTSHVQHRRGGGFVPGVICSHYRVEPSARVVCAKD